MLDSRLYTAIAVLVFLSFAPASPALAADVGIGLRIGTHGAGAEVGVGFTKRFTVRAGLYDLTISDSLDEGGIQYEVDVELGGTAILADFFPMGGSFHITAGIFSNDNEILLTSTFTEDQQIGGTVYTPAQIGELSGRVSFDETAPYLGIGWGNVARGKRVGFLFDLGVLKQGSGQVELSTTGSAVSSGDLGMEALELEDEISDFNLWPVIAVGLSIRF